MNEEATIFILQINPPQYWRIEIMPAEGREINFGTELQDVLAKVLMLDKTPCPFQRGFTIDLPSPPQTPMKKRPWKPVEKPSLASMPLGPSLPEFEKPLTPHTPRGNNPVKDFMSFDGALARHDSSSETRRPVGEPDPLIDTTQAIAATQVVKGRPMSDLRPISGLATPPGTDAAEPRVLKQCNRSITVPPKLSLVASPPSKRPSATTGEATRGSRRHASLDSESDISSAESFHSLQSWDSPVSDAASGSEPDELSLISPTPRFHFPHDNITVSRHLGSNMGSEVTLSPDADDPPRTPPLLTHEYRSETDTDRSGILTPPSSQLRQRLLVSDDPQGRAHSPVPTRGNPLSSSAACGRRDMRSTRHIPIAIIQKTCEILMSPPSHLLHLMLNIAAKIAAGEWRDILAGNSHTGEAVHWDIDRNEWIDEDDFGVQLGSIRVSKPIHDESQSDLVSENKSDGKRYHMSGSWDVD